MLFQTRPYALLLLFLAFFSTPGFSQEPAPEGVALQGELLEVTLDSSGGCVADVFGLRTTGHDMAGAGGLLQEGFGSTSYYVPNRRLDEEIVKGGELTASPVIRYAYDCDGPNIEGLEVSRQMELIPGSAALRVVWTVKNTGSQRQWVAPWVRNIISPGGSTDTRDRLDLPVFEGVINPKSSGWHPAARNWAAATDPERLETFYTVFNVDHIHSFLALNEEQGMGFQGAFVPRVLGPGEAWQTTYVLGAVRGLRHVDFATDELAAQIDYEPGRLTVLLSGVKQMKDLHLIGRVVAENGRSWKLETKAFSIDPNTLARCTYEWEAPAPGVYEFLGQLRHRGQVVPLGELTASPHGGIDTQFAVGNPATTRLEPWSDAPLALERRGRRLERTLAARSPAKIWFEPSLNKLFPEDVVVAQGADDPSYSLSLARGESESVQVAIQPEDGRDLMGVQVVVHDLVNAAASVRIESEDIGVYNVNYVDVRVPTHFEGPTGPWPDPLPPFESFHARGGRVYPVWLTVHAPRSLPAGTYRGLIEVQGVGQAPAELWLEVEVWDFELPTTPALKTDFGFRPEAAIDAAGARPGSSRAADVLAAYIGNALRHRVTLREGAQLPEPQPNYPEALDAYRERLRALRAEGATTFAVPEELLQTPADLAAANAFVRQQGLTGRAFVPLAHEPPYGDYAELLAEMARWEQAAPDIPMMVATRGMRPFAPDDLDIWTMHAQVFDTPNNQSVLEAIEEGHEVWWYVGHTPPRPYGNFFLDFAAIEHRILFWQTWALGLKGMHYWSVNWWPEGQSPFESLLDITPVNGDGLLLYPGPHGPINSIRWETIRDGIEDHDYLTLLAMLRLEAGRAGGHEAVLAETAGALDLDGLVPDLVNFSRDHELLLQHRRLIAQAIVRLRQALAR